MIFILADDLGYGELGVLGQQKIRTPHIDALAAQGMLFTQHYSGSPVCAPARCVFLTGKHTGNAYIRGNDEWAERGDVWNYAKASSTPALEGQRPMPANTNTLARVLQGSGYRTGIFGKWGLGAPGSDGIPTKQGFDYFFGYNCQRQAHNLFPPHLWENTSKFPLDNDLVSPHKSLDSLLDPSAASSYQPFTQREYAPAVIHTRALQFIEENQDRPFFLYYASPLPHLPLQAPKDELAAYQEKNWDQSPYTGPSYFPNQHPRATYATMISYLDAQIGELISTLKSKGLYENTIVIFSSDNGPTYTGGVDYEFFESSKPFTNGYGRTKGFVYEGGIRVPLIVSWPGQIAAGTTNDHISAFYDLLPTICDLTGTDTPKDTDGISFKPALFGEEQAPHDFLYWEFPSYKGQQAVRIGNWKGVRTNIFEGNLTLELYDLSKDLGEQNDLAAAFPEVVAEMEAILKMEHTPSTNDKFKFGQLGDQ